VLRTYDLDALRGEAGWDSRRTALRDEIFRVIEEHDGL